MKTIKNIETGEVKRVKDSEAYGSAPKGFKYCGKSESKPPKPAKENVEKNNKKQPSKKR